MEKLGVVDVGGGMRDVYGAGIFDYCQDNQIRFDCCVGVSAGSANIASFLAGQHGRNYKFYMEYAFRKEYISIGNWIRNRNFVNLDYSYGTLSNSDGECPLDYPALCGNPAQYIMVAANALTGEPVYFNKSDLRQDAYHPIKASGTVPVANKPFVIGQIPYYDGGIADPIPVKKCLETGCDRVVLILTRPKDSRRTPDKDRFPSRLLKHSYPNASRALAGRAELYNRQLEEAIRMEKQGTVLILAPDDIGQMKTLTKDREVMERLYRKGYEDARQISEWL